MEEFTQNNPLNIFKALQQFVDELDSVLPPQEELKAGFHIFDRINFALFGLVQN